MARGFPKGVAAVALLCSLLSCRRIEHGLPVGAPCVEEGPAPWLLCNARDLTPYQAAAEKAAELAAKWGFDLWSPDFVMYANVAPEPGDEAKGGVYYEDGIAIILLDEARFQAGQVAQSSLHEVVHAILHRALGWEVAGAHRHEHPIWRDVAWAYYEWPCSFWALPGHDCKEGV
jgi:hypothetical protein